MDKTILEAVNDLWDYHHVNHQLEKSDIIFVLGSNDSRVAEYAAELYFQGLAPLIIFSGGVGRFTGAWQKSEAELFGDVAKSKGVPENCILLENKSTNTGENVRFSREILKEAGFGDHLKVLAIQKPYMERRTLATLEKQWPEADIQVSSPPCKFEEYITESLPADFVINAMIGDFQRILEYPKQGFSTEQPVTQEALSAFKTLVEAGYDSQLLANVPLPWEK